jgi:hypothetical protein
LRSSIVGDAVALARLDGRVARPTPTAQGIDPLPDLPGDAADHRVVRPAHGVDERHGPGRGDPAEIAITLDEQHLRAEPCRRDGGTAAGNAAAGDQYVRLVDDRHFQCFLDRLHCDIHALSIS